MIWWNVRAFLWRHYVPIALFVGRCRCRLTNRWSGPTRQSSNLHAQICRLPGGPLNSVVRRHRRHVGRKIAIKEESKLRPRFAIGDGTLTSPSAPPLLTPVVSPEPTACNVPCSGMWRSATVLHTVLVKRLLQFRAARPADVTDVRSPICSIEATNRRIATPSAMDGPRCLRVVKNSSTLILGGCEVLRSISAAWRATSGIWLMPMRSMVALRGCTHNGIGHS